jgi:uncharacterized RDD family membrane protein YckC
VTHDPLNRPLPDHLLPKMQAAGDVMLAGFLSRLISCMIDSALILAIFYCVIWLLVEKYGAISANIVCICLLTLWGFYLTIFSVTKGSATIGQKLTKIRLYSLFTAEITLGIALNRFILMSYPIIIASCIAPTIIANYLLPNEMVQIGMDNLEESLIYTILFVCICVQLFLLFPLITNNFRNISWDNTLRLCVIKTTLY